MIENVADRHADTLLVFVLYMVLVVGIVSQALCFVPEYSTMYDTYQLPGYHTSSRQITSKNNN